MFSGTEIADLFTQLSITHVVWLPDSELGRWEPALDRSPAFQLIRICREGEAWPLAAGLHLGGKRPMILMQITGLFESGDAMRNVLFDLQMPLFAILGARNWLVKDSRDSAKTFTEPILRAWGLDYRLIATQADKPVVASYYHHCQQQRMPGAVLLAEGQG